MRLYRLLLRLYPASFRHSYGEQMEAIFEDSPVPGKTLRACLDVLVNAPAAHLEILAQDLKYCRRALVRSPGFAATVIAVTAIAVGAASAVLAVADRVFLNPLPFKEPDRLVMLFQSLPGYSEMELSPPNYRDWKSMSTSFESIAAWRGQAANLTGAGQPVHVEGAAVTWNLLDVLGVRPSIGRGFAVEDDNPAAPATILLSDALWKELFGSDLGVIGRKVSLDNRPYVVLGVMPSWFRHPSRLARYWTVMRFERADFEDRANNYLYAVGRLKPGVTVDAARAELNTIAAGLERAYPRENADTAATVTRIGDRVGSRSRTMLWALCAAVASLLLIACMNLASLFVARGLSRRRELSIRTALGAGPERLVRQLATEGFLLAAVGGAAGLWLAALLLPLLGHLVPESLPVAIPSLDARTALTTGLVALFACVLFSVLPAWQASRVDAARGMREGAREGFGAHTQHARSTLVVVEVALSVVLLIGSGLLVRALSNVRSIDPGFRSGNVLTLRTPLPMPKYELTAGRTQFYDRVLSGVRAIGGVSAAGYISFLPIAMRGGIWPVGIGGQTANRAERHTASLRFITPGYLEAMRIPLLRGRSIANTDIMGRAMAAVVSESFARRYWPDQDPIGRTFHFALAERTIVGVAGDVRVRGLERHSEPQVYLPYQQVPDGALTWYAPKDLVIRASGDPSRLTAAIRAIIRAADSEQPVTDVRLLREVVESDSASRLLQVRLLAAFAGTALLLAAVGLYGLMSYSVSQRMREFGVRIALGAQALNLFALVMRQSLTLTIIGVALGAILAALAGTWIESLLFGVNVGDRLTWLTAIGSCVLAVSAGALRPALRAATVDAIAAIRRD